MVKRSRFFKNESSFAGPMHPLARYTQRAREFAFKHPVFTEINIHINYWVISFALLGTIIFFYDRALLGFFEEIESIPYWQPLRTTVFSGFLYGLGTGLIRSLVINKRLDHLSSISRLIIESLVYFLFFILVWRLGFLFAEEVFSKRGLLKENKMAFIDFQLYSSSALVIYVFFNILLLNFILQINTKFGPGVLIPMLLGYYRRPEIEDRIFLFMDLKGSTGIAEKLGHLRYSEMIRDCFREANYSVTTTGAQIYQYVGDEIVITWEKTSGIKNHRCLEFFADFQRRMKTKESQYLEKYGVFPEFKAGLHLGDITAIEVGVIKRDIAFHGDTINSASRIQDLCNPLEKYLLFSRDLKEELEKEAKIENMVAVGEHKLKGKMVKLDLYSLEGMDMR